VSFVFQIVGADDSVRPHEVPARAHRVVRPYGVKTQPQLDKSEFAGFSRLFPSF